MKTPSTHYSLFPIVAIPARNEERRLPALLAGLAVQTWLGRDERRLSVVIAMNNCDDGSAAVVRDCASRFPNLSIEPLEVRFETPLAHVGSARRLAMDTAYAACAAPLRSVILTTDADSVPATDWVENNLRHVEDGVHLVGGLIIGDPAEEQRLGPDFRRRAMLHFRYAEATDRLASLIDPVDHDPWPRHRDHTGASLAVRADVYRDIDGMPLLPLREDLAFVGRALERGYLLRHPLDVRVQVSARLAGRAPGGMADTLKEWMRAAAAGAPVLVEDPAKVRERLLKRRRLRDVGSAPSADRAAIAASLGLDAEVVRAAQGVSVPSAFLIQRFAPDEPDAEPTAPVETAIAMVEQMIEEAKGKAYAA